MISFRDGKYRADLDGLRAISVLPVIFYHFHLPFFDGGYVGVDIFFVISGYLITGILLEKIYHNKFSFVGFYEGRIRRLYPAFILMISSSFLLSFMLKDILSFFHFVKSLLYLSFFSSNILFSFQESYFDIGVSAKPLLHTWSLSIEEQFYLFWPMILILLHRYDLLKKRIFFALFCSFSFFTIILTPLFQKFSFYHMPTRAFELLLGAYAATIPKFKIKHVILKILISSLTFIGLFIPIFIYTTKTLFPGYAALLPCLGAFLFIKSSPDINYCNRILSLRSFVFIGLISYPLYLWHWPIFVYYLNTIDPLLEFYKIKIEWRNLSLLALFIFIFILSTVTYKLVELPIRKKIIVRKRKNIFLIFFSTSLLIFLTSIFALNSEKIRNYSSKVLFADEGYADLGSPYYYPNYPNLEKIIQNSMFIIGKSEVPVSYIIWGDSQADQFKSLFGKFFNENNISGLFICNRVPALGVLRETAETFSFDDNKKLIEFTFGFIEENKIKHVVISSLWNYFLMGASNGEGKKYGIKPNQNNPAVYGEDREISGDIIFEKQFLYTINEIRKLGAEVWLIAPIPEQNINAKNFFTVLNFFGLDYKQYYLDRHQHDTRSKKIFSIFSKMPDGVHIIDPSKNLCQESRCLLSHNSRLLYMDESHLTTYGATFLSDLFEPLFSAIKLSSKQ